MKKKLLTTIFLLLNFLLISYISIGETKKNKEGYIITNSGEKLEGNIKITSAVHKSKSIIFISNEGKKQKYNADDLQEYKIGNDLHVSVKIMGHKHKVFLKKVITKNEPIYVYYYYHKPAKNTTLNPCAIIIYGDDYVVESNGKKVGAKTFRKKGEEFVLINHCEDSGSTTIIHH